MAHQSFQDVVLEEVGQAVEAVEDLAGEVVESLPPIPCYDNGTVCPLAVCEQVVLLGSYCKLKLPVDPEDLIEI